LADRSIFLTLAPIGKQERRSEGELWHEFAIAQPRILAGLFDATACGLRGSANVNLSTLPRMADFALWATACGSVLWPALTFMSAYEANRSAVVERVIEADPLAACIQKLVLERGSWAGTASDLLHAITALAADHMRHPTWPKHPAGLAGRLRRAQPFLRVQGIDICFSRERRAGTRTITITAGLEHPLTPSASSARHGAKPPAA
jgi:hypothetical protein